MNSKEALKVITELDIKDGYLYISDMSKYLEAMDVIDDHLSVLEILKAKPMSLYFVPLFYSVEEYNSAVSDKSKLTEEEFCLIKKCLRGI